MKSATGGGNGRQGSPTQGPFGQTIGHNHHNFRQPRTGAVPQELYTTHCHYAEQLINICATWHIHRGCTYVAAHGQHLVSGWPAVVTFGQNPAFGRVLTAAILPNLLNKDVLCTFWEKLTTHRSTLGPLCVVIGQLWQKHCRESCHSQGLTRQSQHSVNIWSTVVNFGQLWSTLRVSNQ